MEKKRHNKLKKTFTWMLSLVLLMLGISILGSVKTEAAAAPRWSSTVPYGVSCLLDVDGTIYAGSNSPDSGGVWSYRNGAWIQMNGMTDHIVTALVNMNNTLYAATNYGSNDVWSYGNGAWAPMSGSPENTYSLLEADGTLYAGAKEGIFKYADGTWTKMDGSPSMVYSLVEMNDTIYAGRQLSSNDVWSYSNGAWSQLNGSPGGVTSLIEVDGTLYAGINGGIYTYSGDTWTKMSAAPVQSIYTLYKANGTLYAGTDGGIYTYNGSAWTKMSGSPEGTFSMLEADGTLYAGGTKAMWCYRGGSWEPMSPGIINSIQLVGNTVYVGTDEAVWSYSGGVWTRMNGSPGYVMSLQYFNGALYAGTKISSESEDVWCYSGGTWTRLNGSPNSVASLLEMNGTLYAESLDSNSDGVYFYHPADGSWTELTGLPQHFLYEPTDLKEINGRLYVGTVNGIYVYDWGSWSIVTGTSHNVTYSLAEADGMLYARFQGNYVVCFITDVDGGVFSYKVDDIIKPMNDMIYAGGIIYMGTSDGLYTNAAPNYSPVTGAPEGVNCLQYEDGILYVGANGLYLYSAPDLPVITTATLPDATVGTPYSITLEADGEMPITWSATLPAGLSLSPGGVLSGTPTRAGYYGFTIRAANSLGGKSEDFSIFVNDSSGAAISAQPANRTVTAGGTTNFTVAAEPAAGGTLSYQWQYSPNGGKTWMGAWESGKNTNTLTLDDYSTEIYQGGGLYRCIVTDSICGKMASEPALLTVAPYDVAPRITGPSSMGLTEGYAAAATGKYTIIGTEPVTVTKTSGNSKITWNDTTKKLDIAPGLAAGTYPVTLTAANSMEPDAAFNFTLTVSTAPITYTATVTVNKDGSEWSTGVPAITIGADSISALPNGSAFVDGTYNIYADGADTGVDITVSGAAGAAALNYYTLTLNAGTGITSVSGDGVYLSGASANIDAVVSGGYTWEKWSDDNTTKNRTITVTATTSLTATATVTPPPTYTATAAVNKDGSVWTSGAPVITIGTASGTASANGSPFVDGTYNIYADGVDTNVDITVSGAAGTATLNYYTLTLSAGTGITSVSGDGVYLSGASANIDAVVSGGYTWEKWSDDNTTKNRTITVTATDSLTATATVTPPPTYTATAAVNKDGSVWTFGAPVITIGTASGTASANGSPFVDGIYNIYADSIDTGVYITVSGMAATAILNYYTLTLSAGTGITSVSGDGVYLSGASAIIDAVVSGGYTWEKWSDNNTTKARTLAISDTVNLTAAATVTPQTFVPVTDITGVPAAATAGTPLTLIGTVVPADATNKTIAWSVQDAGDTGAAIADNILSTTAAGIVIVRATITNGLTESTNYTQDFSITVTTAPITTYTVTASARSGGSISPNGPVDVTEGGTQTFTITSNPGYRISSVTVDGAPQGVITTYTFTNVAANHTIDATFTGTNAGGGGGGGSPSTPTAPNYNADVKAGNGGETTLPVTVDKNTGTASTVIGSQKLTSSGTVITVPSIPDVDTYSVGIPVPDLSATNAQGRLTLQTDNGSVTVPSNMLEGVSDISGSKAEITIGRGNKENLPADVKAAIGDKPLIRLTLSIDGIQTDWSNRNAPVTVSIPYTPTAAELADPGSIVVWYIDGSGNVVTIPNGQYDPAAGTVIVDVTHFSDYAVAYNKVSFNDVPASAWYRGAVSFIAAREITSGSGNGNYSPDAKLTRGEFIVLMMRAYGISPDTNPADNFADSGNTYYTGYLAAAKRLGISSGVGNNRYAPGRDITRQEMFSLIYSILKVSGQLPQGDSGKSLSSFSDAGQIDSWAKNAMTLLVETGTIGGNNGMLTPKSTATRAEMAQVLYNLLSK